MGRGLTAGSGLLAGVAGSGVMHAFRAIWELAIDNQQGSGLYGLDHEADVKGARLVNAILSRKPLTEPEAAKLGMLLHYALGAGLGFCYGLASPYRRKRDWRHGAALGAALWVFADWVPISLSGIYAPVKKTFASHAGALATHVLFGMVVERLVIH